MPNHPQRSVHSPGPAANPKPAEVRAAREAAGLTMAEAAALVYVGLRAWQRYEAKAEAETDGERNPEWRPMHPSMWDLFNRKLAERAAAKVMDGIPRGP